MQASVGCFLPNFGLQISNLAFIFKNGSKFCSFAYIRFWGCKFYNFYRKNKFGQKINNCINADVSFHTETESDMEFFFDHLFFDHYKNS